MGIFFVLTSLLVAFSAAPPPEPKHRRTEALTKALQPKPSPAPKAADEAVQAHRPKEGAPGTPDPAPGASTAAGQPTAPAPAETTAVCESTNALAGLFTSAQAHFPAASPEGVYYVRDGALVHQTQPHQAPVALPAPALPATGLLSSATGSELAVLTQGPRAWFKSAGDAAPAFPPLAENTAINGAAWASSQTVYFTAATRNAKDFDLFRWKLGDTKTETLAVLNGDYRITDVAPLDKALALVRGTQVAVWRSRQKDIKVVGEGAPGTPAYFSRDGTNLLWLAGNGPKHLVISSVQKPAPRTLTMANTDVLSFRPDPSRMQMVLVASVSETQTRFFAWEMEKDGSLRGPLSVPAPQGQVSEPVALVPVTNSLETRFFFTRQGSLVPPGIWFWDGTKETLWSPTDSGTKFSSGCWDAGQRVESAPDFKGGVRVFGASAQAARVVVPASDAGAYSPTVAYLLRRGFRVLRPEKDGPTPEQTLRWEKARASHPGLFALGFESEAADLTCQPGEESLQAVRECVELFSHKKKGPHHGGPSNEVK